MRPNARELNSTQDARSWLYQTEDIYEVDKFRNELEQIVTYHSKQRDGMAKAIESSRCLVWTERRLGELRALYKTKGARLPVHNDYGISVDDGNRYDAISAIPASDFERLLDEEAVAKRPINTWSIIGRWQEKEKEPESKKPPSLKFRNSPARTAEEAAAREQKVIDLLNQGYGTHAIAKMLGTTPFRITEVKRRLGITAQDRQATEDRKQKVYDLSLQGKSLTEIAEVTGLKPKSVSDIRRRLGLIEKAKEEARNRDDRIRELSCQGVSNSEIAQAVGMAVSSVSAAKTRLGITEEIRTKIAEQDSKIVELSQKGYEAGKIAADLKISPKQVYHTKTKLRIGGLSKHDPFIVLTEMVFQCSGTLERAMNEENMKPPTIEKADEMRKELIKLRRAALRFMKEILGTTNQDKEDKETEETE